MAAKISVDHKGQTFPSFKAMCEEYHKKPDTVRRRMKKDWSKETALEIPEVPGYSYKLMFVGIDEQWRFKVKINKNYRQHEEFNGKIMTLKEIKDTFPQSENALNKGRMMGIF